MIHKTRGVVLHNIKYTDNSVISHIYTEKFGRIPFMISGTRGKRSQVKINLLGHLSILEMEVYIKQTRDIQRVKEIRLDDCFRSIPYDPVKNAIALFLAEILYRTLQEQESNPPLFSYLASTIKILDLSEEGFANFHLMFLIGLSRHLGFYPRNNYTASEQWFDIENARFTGSQPLNLHFLNPRESQLLSSLMSCSFEEMDSVKLTGKERITIIKGLLDFYKYHLPGMGQVKSLPVLMEIF